MKNYKWYNVSIIKKYDHNLCCIKLNWRNVLFPVIIWISNDEILKEFDKCINDFEYAKTPFELTDFYKNIIKNPLCPSCLNENKNDIVERKTIKSFTQIFWFNFNEIYQIHYWCKKCNHVFSKEYFEEFRKDYDKNIKFYIETEKEYHESLKKYFDLK